MKIEGKGRAPLRQGQPRAALLEEVERVADRPADAACVRPAEILAEKGGGGDLERRVVEILEIERNNPVRGFPSLS